MYHSHVLKLQDGVTPENCRLELDQVLNDPAVRQKQIDAFEKIIKILGPENAINQAAGAIAKSYSDQEIASLRSG